MDKEEEVDLIVKVLLHPAGFNVSLFGDLIGIRSHSDGYEVSWIENNGLKYKDFAKVVAAAEFFVDKRYELELGLDIEYDLLKKRTT